MKQTLIIATRGSKLALRQSEIVKKLIMDRYPGTKARLLKVTTHGDVDQTTPLSGFGSSGVFVKGLEEKLLSGKADIAVHSLKDVPSETHPDLVLAAFPDREDVRDVLVSRKGESWKEIKEGSVIGTSSPARQEQMKELRPDLVFKDIRGNVESRIKKVHDGEYDATILAAAGLNRLGIEIQDGTYFTLDEMVPSPGQGALAIQVNKNNRDVLDMMTLLNRKNISNQVRAERAFMTVIGGGCRFPVAAHADVSEEGVIFRGIAYKPEFKRLEKVHIKTSGRKLTERAIEGAWKIMAKYKTYPDNEQTILS